MQYNLAVLNRWSLEQQKQRAVNIITPAQRNRNPPAEGSASAWPAASAFGSPATSAGPAACAPPPLAGTAGSGAATAASPAPPASTPFRARVRTIAWRVWMEHTRTHKRRVVWCGGALALVRKRKRVSWQFSGGKGHGRERKEKEPSSFGNDPSPSQMLTGTVHRP